MFSSIAGVGLTTLSVTIKVGGNVVTGLIEDGTVDPFSRFYRMCGCLLLGATIPMLVLSYRRDHYAEVLATLTAPALVKPHMASAV